MRALAPILVALAACAALALGCAKTREVTRVDPDTTIDYDYRFDDEDATQTANTMIADALARPWLNEYVDEQGRRPTIIVGEIRNDTSDYIDTKLFTKQFERALLNSGRVRLVGARDERGQLRDERLQGQEWSRPETVKRMAYELGADLMLLGRVGESVDRSRTGRRRTVYYQVNLELIDIESNEKWWIGEQRIKKKVRDRG